NARRERWYKGEDAVRTADFESFEQTGDFILSITNSQWWQDRTSRNQDDVSVIHKADRRGAARSTATAYWPRREVKLRGKWSWNKIVALHELAHLMAPYHDWHSPLFTAIFLMLVRRYD